MSAQDARGPEDHDANGEPIHAPAARRTRVVRDRPLSTRPMTSRWPTTAISCTCRSSTCGCSTARRRDDGALHLRRRPFKAAGQNGTLSLGLDPVGEFSLYLQRRPAGTFDDPASFAKGECIATFRRTSLVVGTTVHHRERRHRRRDDGAADRHQRLLRAPDRQHALRVRSPRHDLAEHLGRGITQFGISAETPSCRAAQGLCSGAAVHWLRHRPGLQSSRSSGPRASRSLDNLDERTWRSAVRKTMTPPSPAARASPPDRD